MKRIEFKPVILVILIIGVTAIAFLLSYRGVQSDSLADSLSNFNSSENSAILSPSIMISEESGEYAVYSALLNELFVKDNESLVVQRQTVKRQLDL